VYENVVFTRLDVGGSEKSLFEIHEKSVRWWQSFTLNKTALIG
jgi:hypothetical protein